MRKTPLRAKKSLQQSTQEKNRVLLAAGKPLPEMKRSTPLPAKAKKKKRSRREVAPEFLEFIRRQRCSVPNCEVISSQAHHMKTVGSGGSDYTAVPLCGIHHTWPPGIHSYGLTAFEARYKVDMWAINTVMREKYDLMKNDTEQIMGKQSKTVPGTNLQSTGTGKNKVRTGKSTITEGGGTRLPGPVSKSAGKSGSRSAKNTTTRK